MSFKNKFWLSAVFFCAFNFSATAADYVNNDLSSNISDNGNYENVTILNNRTLSHTDSYVYLSGTISGNVDVTNSGSITSTHGNYDTFFLPNLSGSTSASTVTFNNNGTIASTGGSATAIYIPSSGNFNFVLNNTATISSAGDYGAIYTFNGSGNSYEITNSGVISNIGDGSTLNLEGGSATITNSGTIAANSDSNNAIYTTGNLTLNILAGSTITGKISGGSNNILNIQTNISATAYNTLVAQLTNGTWTKNMASGTTLTIGSGDTVASTSLSGGGAIANSGTLSALSVSGSGNSLTLASGSSTGNIANSGALAISTSSDIAYENVISGTGSITKTGSGRLELTGTNTYNGATTVSAGELKVNGSAASSAVTVGSGATISGTGTVGDLTIQSGGTLAAGNSPGTLNVSGALNLASGSISNFEFTSSLIDKTIASGNITITSGAIANFQLFGTDGYFTVSQNILESTGGTVSGTFSTVTTDNGFSTNLTYGASAVHAVVSKTLNSNALDGPLSSQNSVGRLVGKSLIDQLRNSRYYDNKKTTAWISGGGFGSYMAANGSSSAYSTNGQITSAGLINNYGDFQLVGGVFNSQANVKRFTYYGKDDIDTSGFAIGAGKNFASAAGNLYVFSQAGMGFYNFDTNRNVNVNGVSEVGKGSGNGRFEYLNLGVAHTVPTSLSGEVGVFTSATWQRTQHNGWHEAGLSAGNLNVSRSSMDTLNYEVGTSYKDDLPKILSLKKNSFYKLELTGYKSDLHSKKNATVTQGSASYSLAPTYTEKFTLGASVFFSTPISENSTITTRFDKRQNGNFREFIATAAYLYGF